MRISLFGKGGPPTGHSFTDPSTKGRTARGAGDRARDLGDWSEAARFYAEYLSVEPNDFAIWVQLGNSRKELGDYEGALHAYDNAIRLDDREPDVRLQKGHALKLARRISEAIASYRLSVELTPNAESGAARTGCAGAGRTGGRNRRAYASRLGDARDGPMAAEGH